MTKAEVKQYVYDFLYEKGLPHISICAVMGNITGESGFDPDIVENGSGVGFGLCQWSYSRRTQLESYGTTLEHQCEFLWSELTGKNTDVTGADYQWIANCSDAVDNGEGFTFSNSDFLAGNGDVATLTKAFCYCWERPAYATNHLTETRIPSAQEFYTTMSYSGGSTTAIDDAVAWCLEIANDDSHGYDQTNRWGPDYDCSSFLIQAWENAGAPVKTNGATYTGNMISIFKQCGFVDVTDQITLSTGDGLVKGDIVWKSGHTEMCSKTGYLVGAHINELGEVVGGQTGDQTTKEIYERTYYNSPWTTVIRYKAGSTPDEPGLFNPIKNHFNFLLLANKRRTTWKRKKF